MPENNWENYEEVAAHLLNQFAIHFGLGRFEGKQVIPGQSGADWEIDAMGYSIDDASFLLVECKRYSSGRIKQEVMASLAYRIKDTGASGGIIVTPIDLQKGAKTLANHEGIKTVKLDINSTKTEYFIEFLNQFRAGFSDVFPPIQDSLKIIMTDKDGNIDSREM